MSTRLLSALLALLLLLAGTSAAGGIWGRNEFRVERVETRIEDGVVVMDARIDYEFSELALEALDNGVPLTLEVHIQVRRAGAWVWEESLLDRRLRYVIRFKPLSERYLVTRLPSTGGRSYVTRDAAIAALGEIEGMELIALDRLEPGEDYQVQLQAFLDIEELPLPLRPIAYLRPAWKLSSGWTKWPLRP